MKLKQFKTYNKIWAMGLAGVLTAGAGMLVGCDDGSSSTPEATGETSAPAVEKESGSMLDNATKQLESGTKKAEEVIEKTSKSIDEGTEKVVKKIEDTKAQATEAAQAMVTKANDLIAQAKGFIDTKNFKMADSTIAQLETMLEKLPVELQEQIKSLRAMVSQAMAAAEKLSSLTAPKVTTPNTEAAPAAPVDMSK